VSSNKFIGQAELFIKVSITHRNNFFFVNLPFFADGLLRKSHANEELLLNKFIQQVEQFLTVPPKSLK